MTSKHSRIILHLQSNFSLHRFFPLRAVGFNLFLPIEFARVSAILLFLKINTQSSNYVWTIELNYSDRSRYVLMYRVQCYALVNKLNMDSIEESMQSNEFSEWLRSSNLTEYAEKFSENGFDNIDLLKSMDEGEITSMIEDIGIEKRGHIMKIKKCLKWLKAPVTQTVSVNTRPQCSKNAQTNNSDAP